MELATCFGHPGDNRTLPKSPSVQTSFYHGTPSPADSGVMSPMTPLSSWTGSTPEHLSNGLQSSPFPVQPCQEEVHSPSPVQTNQDEVHSPYPVQTVLDEGHSPFPVASPLSCGEEERHFYGQHYAGLLPQWPQRYRDRQPLTSLEMVRNM